MSIPPSAAFLSSASSLFSPADVQAIDWIDYAFGIINNGSADNQFFLAPIVGQLKKIDSSQLSPEVAHVIDLMEERSRRTQGYYNPELYFAACGLLHRCAKQRKQA